MLRDEDENENVKNKGNDTSPLFYIGISHLRFLHSTLSLPITQHYYFGWVSLLLVHYLRAKTKKPPRRATKALLLLTLVSCQSFLNFRLCNYYQPTTIISWLTKSTLPIPGNHHRHHQNDHRNNCRVFHCSKSLYEKIVLSPFVCPSLSVNIGGGVSVTTSNAGEGDVFPNRMEKY